MSSKKLVTVRVSLIGFTLFGSSAVSSTVKLVSVRYVLFSVVANESSCLMKFKSASVKTTVTIGLSSRSAIPPVNVLLAFLVAELCRVI